MEEEYLDFGSFEGEMKPAELPHTYEGLIYSLMEKYHIAIASGKIKSAHNILVTMERELYPMIPRYEFKGPSFQEVVDAIKRTEIRMYMFLVMARREKLKLARDEDIEVIKDQFSEAMTEVMRVLDLLRLSNIVQALRYVNVFRLSATRTKLGHMLLKDKSIPFVEIKGILSYLDIPRTVTVKGKEYTMERALEPLKEVLGVK